MMFFLQENTIAPHPDFPVGNLRLENATMIDCLYRVKDALFGGRLFIPDSIWLYRLFKDAKSATEPLRSELISRLDEIATQRRRRWFVHSLLTLSTVKQALEKARASWSGICSMTPRVNLTWAWSAMDAEQDYFTRSTSTLLAGKI